jgi:hypothetical protein
MKSAMKKNNQKELKTTELCLDKASLFGFTATLDCNNDLDREEASSHLNLLLNNPDVSEACFSNELDTA